MVKNYKGINSDLRYVLVKAKQKVEEDYHGRLNTSRYPDQVKQTFEEEMEIINRLKDALPISD